MCITSRQIVEKIPEFFETGELQEEKEYFFKDKKYLKQRFFLEKKYFSMKNIYFLY